jgi:hypothetical protein
LSVETLTVPALGVVAADASWWKQDVHHSLTELWITAILGGLAVSVAFATLPLVSPRTGAPLGRGARIAAAPLPVLGGAIYVLAASTRKGYDETTALELYSLAVWSLAATRLIFARWVRRYRSTIREHGGSNQRMSVKHGSIFVCTLLALIGSLAVVLDRLPLLWA